MYAATLLLLSCGTQVKETALPVVERLDPGLDSLVDRDARPEILARGFGWTEGPLWLESTQTLLFSDIPGNAVHAWTEKGGTSLYLKPSGYTGSAPRGGETGANGLALNHRGQLVLCQHGNRQVAVMTAALDQPKAAYEPLAAAYEGQRFNSPNDLVFDRTGNLYFTDPPYGLEKNMEDPSKEMPFQGVFRRDTAGAITLLTDTITRPNGILLTRDERHLIVANSDPEKPYWYLYDLSPQGTLSNGRIFYDATAASKKDQGMPDGLKTDAGGNIFATGPGGVWIFHASGRLLGRIRYPELVSNCALTPDGKTLFLTADDYLVRVRLRK
jgi:gluconolactonase